MTYKPTGAFNEAIMSEEDKRTLAGIKARYAEAAAAGDETAMAAAHSEAEQLRALYGYSGGADGSEYRPAGATADLTRLIESVYDAKRRAKVGAVEREWQRQKQLAEADIEAGKTDYYALRNALASENAVEKRNFAERAAASGLGNGSSAQAELSRSVAFQGALAALGRQQAREEQAGRRKLSLIDEQYAAAIAEAEAEGAQDLAEALYSEALRAVAAEEKAEKDRLAYENELYDRGQTEWKNAYDLAKTAAQYGDYSLLEALGVTVDLSAKSSGKSGGSGKSSGSSSGSSGSKKTSAPGVQELFEAMYEAEPNEYLFLMMNRSQFSIPADKLDAVWGEYREWRNRFEQEQAEAAEEFAAETEPELGIGGLSSRAKLLLAEWKGRVSRGEMTADQALASANTAFQNGLISKTELAQIIAALEA